MIRTLSLIKRLPSLDRAAFRAHYESTHAPLALPHMPGLLRYVRYHVEEELFGEPRFDVVSAFWYRDKAATDAVFEMLENTPAGEAIRADELTFMDKPANRMLPVSERRIVDGEEGNESVFVFVGRPEAMSRFDCSARLVRDHWPALIEKRPTSFALLRDGFPMGGEPPVYDSVLQLTAASYEGLEDWTEGLGGQGYRVVAVRTRRHETDLESARAAG